MTLTLACLAAALSAEPVRVRVNGGAPLYAAATDRVVATAPPHGAVLSVVQDDGDWLTVTNHEQTRTAACGLAALAPSQVAITVRVRAADLSPVIATLTEHRFPDGSAYLFAPGTPKVEATGVEGEVVAAAWAHVPAAAWATRFVPARLPFLPRTFLTKPWNGKFRVGGRAWVRPAGFALPYEADPSREGHVYVDLLEQCMRVDGLTRISAAPTIPGMMTALGYFDDPVPDERERSMVRTGAPLTWPDAAPAGVATEPASLREPELSGDRLCGLAELGPGWEAQMCVAAADLILDPP
jgi:hypothetical protein